MATPWDKRSVAEQRRIQSAFLRTTLLQQVHGHVPYVRSSLVSAGIDPRQFRSVDDLARVPAAMARDVADPGRNPAGPRALILEGSADAAKRFSDRSTMFRMGLARVIGGYESQQIEIESTTRPIHFHLVREHGAVVPVAYTRSDLDLLARAGARLGAVLGLDNEDRVLNLVPFAPSLDFWGIFYMCHGAGLTALHPRGEGVRLEDSVREIEGTAATVVAIPSDEAAHFTTAAIAAGLDLSGLRVLICVGRSLSSSERTAIYDALGEGGAPLARIAGVYGPRAGRVLWGECEVPAGRTETFGFHTYPDFEIVEALSPETGEALPVETPGEITVTPLGFRGGGAPRWRSGDLAVGGITARRCPNCGRTVPRVGPSVLPGAWRRTVTLNGAPVELDLRETASAVRARARDFQVEMASHNGATDLFVYLEPQGDDVEALVDLFEDLDRLDTAPTQIVLATASQIRARLDRAGGAFPRLWDRTSRRRPE